MSLMYDRMMTSVKTYGSLENLPEQIRNQIEALRHAEVFKIDNVARYMFEGSSQEEWGPDDFPNVAPPFEIFWMEYKTPSPERINTTSKGEVQKLVNDISDKLGIDVQSLHGCTGVLFVAKTFDLLDDDEKKKAEQHEDAKWFVTGLSYKEINGNLYRPDIVTFLVSPNGEIVKSSRKTYVNNSKERLIQKFGPAETAGGVWASVNPCLLALSFLHCKNVVVKTEVPTKQFSHAYQKRHGGALVKFKTLDIRPVHKILLDEGQSEQTGLKRALHICRGHFKDFSKGKGLFGKYKGMYWWESQVRGSGIEGTVVKNYNVKRP